MASGSSPAGRHGDRHQRPALAGIGGAHLADDLVGREARGAEHLVQRLHRHGDRVLDLAEHAFLPFGGQRGGEVQRLDLGLGLGHQLAAFVALMGGVLQRLGQEASVLASSRSRAAAVCTVPVSA
jgi:hypothetical protein